MSRYINFVPWVGKNYLSEGYKGKRILVLGESHYCVEELSEGGKCFPLCEVENMLSDCYSQTKDVIDYYINNYNGERYLQTFLCFERGVIGREIGLTERVRFWNSVIFYNFIQYAQAGPRIAPQSVHWEKSLSAFREVLENYMPDYIIVWGARLYGGLPDWEGKHSVVQVGNEMTDVWTYTIKGKEIPAMKVLHPSTPRGKSWEQWHKFYQKFLGLD